MSIQHFRAVASGIDRHRRSIIDFLRKAPGVKLVALFSPEHGLRGDLDQAKIADAADRASGLPVAQLIRSTMSQQGGRAMKPSGRIRIAGPAHGAGCFGSPATRGNQTPSSSR